MYVNYRNKLKSFLVSVLLPTKFAIMSIKENIYKKQIQEVIKMTSTKARAYKRYRAHQRRKNAQRDYFTESGWSGARFIAAIALVSILVMIGRVTEGSGTCKWSGCNGEKISTDSSYCSEHYHQLLNNR